MAYLPILTYHRLLPGAATHQADPKRISVSAAQFESHLRWLARFRFRSVSLEGYVQGLREGRAPRPRTLGITFDDGYEEVFTLGLPLLKKYSFKAMVFAVSGQLGGRNLWDDGQARLMTTEQYRAWADAGMEVGAHTAQHARLPIVDENTARAEIERSKKDLEAALGQAVPLFAYPYGEFTPTVQKIVQDVGFIGAFATDRPAAVHEANLYAMRRAVVFPNNSAWNILWKAQSWYPAYQDRRRR